MRIIKPLINWNFIAPNAAPKEVTLPHTWNNLDGQDGGNDYFRGTCTYSRALDCPKPTDGSRVWLEVTGAAMTAEVSLNGQTLSRHEGGYSTFRVDLTDFLLPEGNNQLTIAVDNSDNDRVYPQKADFTFYGGLYREVNLITVPEAHFALGNWGGSGLRITPRLAEDLHSAEIDLTVYTEEAEGHWVTVSVDGVGTVSAQIQGGQAAVTIPIPQVHLWDGLDDPYLYTAHAELDSGDAVSARFGCRTIKIDAQQGFLLNGRSYPLRGVSRHQDRKGLGNALTLAEHREDLALIREMGANSIRLAHYQHAQAFYDLCDEQGVVVWAEIPYITMHMQNGRENTLSQMRELVIQNYNHPCVAVWGLSNEITAASAVNDALLENHRALNDLCHSLDATRPTTMADVFMLETDSPILDIPDVNSYNLYFGWYLGDLEQNDEFFDEYHEKYPNRPIGFSEYGADANPAYQNSAPQKGDYSETYQCVYHEHILRMIQQRPWMWCSYVWNMFDFAADGRDEGGKHGENQKGLVTFDRKLKKDAFYLYKAYWSKEPFVHICGSRYVERAEDVTEIKIYSNLPEITLCVDGVDVETRKGDKIFTFRVPITAGHSISARCGEYSSVIHIRRVDTPNPDYRMANTAPVTNWFDADEIDPACFSVMDRISDIQRNPEAGAVIQQMMAKGAESRGDVASAVKDNPALQRMIARQTLISLLKQSGADEQAVKQMNRILQRYPKPKNEE